MRSSFARTLTAVLAILFVCSQGTWVLAGTTGGISGVLTETTSASTPIAGATISAVSPSQSARATTDQQGRFSFLSLAPDTYTLSFEKAGYQSAQQGGITVQADQNITVSLQGARALQNIGRTASRASNSLVRPGQTASVYSVNAAQQVAASSLGGGTNLNSAYSAIASVPGVVVPIGNSSWGQSIFIRGGDYTQTGNEVDGIPINRSFDQYAASALSSLGNQEVQVYTGNAPADAQAVGLAGYINQVIKTGTYPGTGNADLGIGAPAFYHKANLEIGGAAPNRNFSYYLASGGYSQDIRIIDQFNGHGYLAQSGNGSLYNYVAQKCGTNNPTVGCYTNASPFLGGLPYGPNGYAVAPVLWGFETNVYDRESIVNLHFGIPHKKNGIKDDVQLLYNIGQVANYPNTSMNAWGPVLNDVVNGTVNGQPGVAGPVTPTFNDQNQYTGPIGAPLTAGDINSVQHYAFPNSPAGRPWGGPVDFNRRDGETNGFAIVKAQYQHNFSDKAYARVYGYSLYSDRLDNGIVGVPQTFVGAFSPDYQISSHTRGVALTSGYQITPEHLISLNLGYTTSNTTRYRNDVAGGAAEAPVAYLVNSANPTGGCFVQNLAGTTTQVACGSAAQYRLPPINSFATNLRPRVFRLPDGSIDPAHTSPTLAAASGLTCGTGTCEYLSINNGQFGARNTVRPKFFNAALSDTWKPTSRLSLDLSLRLDTYSYDLQNTNTTGNQLFVNDYNASHCISGTNITTRAYGAACPSGTNPATLSAGSPNLTFANVLQPRIGATYTLNPYNVLRASYGRFTQPAETSAVQATAPQSSAPSAQFYSNFGFTSYARVVTPEISYNTDFSWEHQFRNTDLSSRITPFYRKTQDEFATILVDPKTNFVASINGQNRTAQGFELALNKGDFSRQGLAAQIAYTYTYASNKYKVFSTGGSFVTGINNSIAAFNAFTRAGGGAPCYTPATDAGGNAIAGGGAPDPACAAGSIANPYYNATPGGMLDPKASYFPYNQAPGFGSGASASYLIPHVASIIVQYKKNRLAVTPSLQFQAGSRYGSPLAQGGIDPTACGPALASAATPSDPRYIYGTSGVGGSAYNAANCSGVIVTPDPFTKKFDAIGEFRQPNLLQGNLQVSYDLSRNVTVQLTAANVFATCFGGSKVPWNVGRLGCNYQNGLAVGNFFNPGDQIQNGFLYPYVPTLATSLQSVSTESPNPFALFIDFKIKKF
jgi:hypothetical protein